MARKKTYKLPTPPARVMSRGISAMAGDFGGLKRGPAGSRTHWLHWHAGIANAPAFPSDARLQEQRDVQEANGLDWQGRPLKGEPIGV